MSLYRTLRVTEIIEEHSDLIKVRLDDDSRAYVYTSISGGAAVGDEVVVNTTAIDLGLGTGGWHFVVWNLSNRSLDTGRGGHIMKMRYAPQQTDTGAAEEFDTFPKEQRSIDGHPVIAMPLLSMVPAVACLIRDRLPNAKIALAVSDGAALPLALADLVRDMKSKGILDTTITFGHSFGGDIESINIYSALIASKHLAHADVTLVSMGPGIVGTNSAVGFTGMEVAYHLDAAQALGGTTYGVVRASAAEERDRHHGISHHAITTYTLGTHEKHNLGVITDHELSDEMLVDIAKAELNTRHNIVKCPSVGVVGIMESYGLNVTSMGRPARDDELFFEMAAAAAQLALADGKIS